MKRAFSSTILLAACICLTTISAFSQAVQAPGQDVVGFGYDIFGRYADMASKKPYRLFDIGVTRIEPIGSDRFEVPEGMMLEPIVDHRISTIEGSSVREYAKNLSVNAGLELNAMVFSASVETNISTSESETEQRFYFTYMDSNIMWRISLDTISMDRLKSRLNAQAREDINNLNPADLFNAYGTHYIASAYLGGRADYNSVSTITDKVSASDIRIAVEAQYKAISAKTDLSSAQKSALSESKTRTEMRVVGGNARFVNNIQDYDQYVRWAEGIETRPVLCDFDANSLRPIWELADSADRRRELESTFEELIKRYPLPPEFVNLGALSRELYMVQSKADGRFWDIGGYHMSAGGKGSPLQLHRPDRVTQEYEGADRFIKIIPHPVESGYVYLQPQHSEFIVALPEKESANQGTQTHLWDLRTDRTEGQFKLESVSDERDTFYIKNRRSGMYLEPDIQANRIVQQPFSGSENQKWVFQVTDPNLFMAPPNQGNYVIQAVAGNLYWDLPGSYPTVRSGDLQLWSGRPGERSLDRIMEIKKIDGLWHTLRPRHLPGHVFAAASRKRIALEAGNRQNHQLWQFEYAGEPNTYYIRNRSTGEAIDVNAGKVNSNGADVNSWPFHGGENQKWRLLPQANVAQALHEGIYWIRMAHSDKYIDLAGNERDANKNGTNVQIWHLRGNEANAGDRRFRFIPHGTEGAFILQFQNGGRVMDVSGGRDQDGQNIHVWNRTNRRNQQWQFIPQGNKETFVISTMMSTRTLDLKEGNSGVNQDGSNVHLWRRHNGRSQLFALVHADGSNRGKLYQAE